MAITTVAVTVFVEIHDMPKCETAECVADIVDRLDRVPTDALFGEYNVYDADWIVDDNNVRIIRDTAYAPRHAR